METGKKGQAALEFLTTYGWAFLVLMIMIGALSYFGIMNPGDFFPDRCTFSSQVICEDYQLTDTDVNLDLRQTMGQTVLMENVTCEFQNGDTDTFIPASPDWSPKSTKQADCTAVSGDNLIPGEKEKVKVTIVYKLDDTGYDHYIEGEVLANVI